MKPLALNDIEGIRHYQKKRTICVYFLCRRGHVFYIGQSTNFESRIVAHNTERGKFEVYILPCRKNQLRKLELKFIRRFHPRLNSKSNEDYCRNNGHGPSLFTFRLTAPLLSKLTSLQTQRAKQGKRADRSAVIRELIAKA